MNKRKILCAIACFMILSIATACELFDGPPVRDNQNDEGAEKAYTVEMNFDTGIDYIGFNYEIIGDLFLDDYNPYFELSYGTESEFESENNINIELDSNDVVINDLEYGSEYNFWLTCSDRDTDELVFLKHGAATPEARGELDVDFDSDGIYALSTIYSDPFAYDVISDKDGNVYVAGASTFIGAQFNLKYDQTAVHDTTFNSYIANAPYEAFCAIVDNSYYAILRRGTAMELAYFQGDGSYSTVPTFFYDAHAAVGTDDNHIIVAGQNGANRYSVMRMTSSMSDTDKTEYSIDGTEYYTNPDSGKVSGLYFNNSYVYAAGWVKDMDTFENTMHAVILDSADIGNVVHNILFNADWDSSKNRVVTIGTMTPLIESGLKIAADDENNVYIAGAGILSKFSENGAVFDMDSTWPVTDSAPTGSIYLEDNFCPVDIAMQKNGKIILFGNIWQDIYAMDAILDKGIIRRFNSDGSKDDTFGTNGIMEFAGVQINRGDLTPQGRIIFAGSDSGGGVIYQIR